MGMIYNHVTLVYDFNIKRLEPLRKKAIELFFPLLERDSDIKTDGEFVSQIFTSPINNESFFIISTDGSKIGWEANSEYQEVRKIFVGYCEEYGVMQIATIEFGDNDSPIITDY